MKPIEKRVAKLEAKTEVKREPITIIRVSAETGRVLYKKRIKPYEQEKAE